MTDQATIDTREWQADRDRPIDYEDREARALDLAIDEWEQREDERNRRVREPFRTLLNAFSPEVKP